MPKKKTGQKKKREKQRVLQKSIQGGRLRDDFKTNPANCEIICDACQRRQKNRFSCYFCQQVQKQLTCCECGRIKCVEGGDCVVKHPGRHVTGMAMMGAICDFCEASICHSRKCLQTHACSCLFREEEGPVLCVECERSMWEHGGRAFRCATCAQWLCEDDQFEHQASCQVLESETYKCISCNRLGVYSCLRCKSCYCSEHVRGHTKVKRGEALPCRKCGYEVQETKDLSMSVRRHDFGRKAAGEVAESGPSNAIRYNTRTSYDSDSDAEDGDWMPNRRSSDDDDSEESSEEDEDDSDEERGS